MENLPYIDVIKQLMIENNLNQQKLADILKVNQTTVSQWLLGHKKPGYDSILAFYENFNITPDVFFGIKLQIEMPELGSGIFTNTWDASDFAVYVLASMYSEYQNAEDSWWQSSVVSAGKLYTID